MCSGGSTGTDSMLILGSYAACDQRVRIVVPTVGLKWDAGGGHPSVA